MLQLLGPHGSSNSAAAVGAETGQGVRGTSVEDFPILLAERYLRLSTHATAARMRSRLFQVWGKNPQEVAFVYEGASCTAPQQHSRVVVWVSTPNAVEVTIYGCVRDELR